MTTFRNNITHRFLFPERARAKNSGVTLVEVAVGATLGSIILLGMLTSFGVLTRSGARLFNYAGMENEARKGLEYFAEDTRMARGITWTDSTSVTLALPHANGDNNKDTITYWWDNNSASPTYHCFRRRVIRTDSSGTTTSDTTTTLLTNVTSFQFDRWTAGGTVGVQATTDNATDQLQIHLMLNAQQNEFRKATTSVASATSLVVSARYILRNKPVNGNTP